MIEHEGKIPRFDIMKTYDSFEQGTKESLIKIDLKKGDVLLVKVPNNFPPKVIRHRCQEINEQVKKIFNGNVQILFIHEEFDLSVIRLEEWFV